MEKEIKEIIEKNLPKQVGDILRGRLEEADEFEKDLKIKKNQLEHLYSDLSSRDNEIKDLISKLELAGNLNERENEVKERELNQKLFEAEKKLEAAEFVNGKIIEFVNALMRNTTYRKHSFPHTHQDYGSNGSYTTVKTGEDQEISIE